MLTASFVRTDEELMQISALSASSLFTNISEEEKAREGFVTWPYPLEVLKELHAIVPSVVIKDGPIVAGYAITLTVECLPVYPTMGATIDHLANVYYKNRALADWRYYIMGQICIRGNYRGLGGVDTLYQYHRLKFSSRYDILITEISVNNPRSRRAHEKVGFRTLDTHTDQLGEWDVVGWDWIV